MIALKLCITAIIVAAVSWNICRVEAEHGRDERWPWRVAGCAFLISAPVAVITALIYVWTVAP